MGVSLMESKSLVSIKNHILNYIQVIFSIFYSFVVKISILEIWPMNNFFFLYIWIIQITLFMDASLT